MAGETTTQTVRIPRQILGPGRWPAMGEGSQLGFMVRKMGFYSVRGPFGEFTVEAQGAGAEADETTTSPRLTIQAASIDTGIKFRDNHLRSGDFLDVERFPRIEFRAERIEHRGGREFSISGPLTVHGVTRPVELAGHVHEHGADVRQIHAAGTLDRYEFGVKAWYPLEMMLTARSTWSSSSPSSGHDPSLPTPGSRLNARARRLPDTTRVVRWHGTCLCTRYARSAACDAVAGGRTVAPAPARSGRRPRKR